MSLTSEDIKKIAHLARLNFSHDDMGRYAPQLSAILQFIETLNTAETANSAPLAHPVDVSQRLRPDEITADIWREKYQKIAPQVDSGFYIVPKVIEEA
jgi:aspartyl-tRNA(Asn)/glutamyl-tRNA(Gln) amidotransferase subunit C